MMRGLRRQAQGQGAWTRATRVLLAGLFVVLACGTARAVKPDEMLPDPAMETRARALSAELRCLVCQNQSIDDFDAPLARDLRLLVRERLKAGDSNDQVRDFLVARYGDFVLLKPPLRLSTLLLWLAPLIVLLAAIAIIARHLRRPRLAGTTGADSPLSKDEERRLASILNADAKANAQDPAT